MRDSFLESATASRQWLIKATSISNRSYNVSVRIASMQMLLNFGHTRSTARSSHEMGDG